MSSRGERKKQEIKNTKRKRALDSPPTGLRVIDKIHMGAMVAEGFPSGTATELTNLAIKFAAKNPIYIIDELLERRTQEVKKDSVFEWVGLKPMKIWFEGKGSGKGFGMLASFQNDFSYLTDDKQGRGDGLATLKNTSAGYYFCGFITTHDSMDVHPIKESAIIPVNESGIGDIDNCVWIGSQGPEDVSRALLEAIVCCMDAINLLSAENIPTKTLQVTRTRNQERYSKAIRKKLPLYEIKVIDIWPTRPKQQSSESSGKKGTKNRWHMVIGHVYVRGGKKYWRRGHERGDKRLGIVKTRKRIRLDDDPS